jgi:hypothetical protein
MPRVQKGPCLASDRMGRGVVSWSCILGDCRPSANLGCVLGGPFAAGLAFGVAWRGSVRDMGLARIRLDLGHRPCRLGHRTPVLYSRNQSRTNIAL